MVMVVSPRHIHMDSWWPSQTSNIGCVLPGICIIVVKGNCCVLAEVCTLTECPIYVCIYTDLIF